MKKDNIYIVGVVIFALDVIVKTIVKSNIKLLETIKVIPGFFELTHVENEGAAFSILSGSKYILIVISIIIMLLLLKYIKDVKKLSNIEGISLGLILGGLLGNLLDRIVNSYVLDYLAFNFFGYHFPVFNLADIAITGGVILLLIATIIKERKEGKNDSRRNGRK
ncbi:MAG: signal peptidase II [Bacilli bacterium]|nr:signal peptidase II [Bacilli bacterium]